MIEKIDELKNLAQANNELYLASILAYVAAAYEDGTIKQLAAVVNDFGQKRIKEILTGTIQENTECHIDFSSYE